MNISIVIPNYNGESLLRKNLPKVLDVVGNSEIIIADDASTDESLGALNGFGTKVRVLRNEKNLGFSSTVNRGVKAAKGDIIVLLNSDVIPEKGFLIPLLSHFKDDRVFAVGCMDKSIEFGKIVLRGRGTGQWKRGFLVHSRGEVNKTSTLWVNGGSGAFRKSMWEKLGGFNELYNPFYWEDIDLSYRALKSGYKILFEPKSVVVHEHEKGAIKKEYSPLRIKTIAYRNQFVFVWKNATDLNLQLAHLFWFPYHAVRACFRGDLAFLKGFCGAFNLLPKIIKSSLEDQKMFVLKDSQV
jgi:GT2 family glycosyltransferase